MNQMESKESIDGHKMKRKKKWRRRELDQEKIERNKQKIKEKRREEREAKKAVKEAKRAAAKEARETETEKETKRTIAEEIERETAEGTERKAAEETEREIAEGTKREEAEQETENGRHEGKRENGSVIELTQLSITVMTILSVACVLLFSFFLYRVFKINLESPALEAMSYEKAEELLVYSRMQYQKILLTKGAGRSTADVLAEVARYMTDSVKNRPPEIELTEDNTADFATIESCVINGETGKVDVTISAPGLAASDDGYYYLFEEKTYENALADREYIIEEPKDTELTISVRLNYNMANSRLFSKFVVAVRKNGEFVAISQPKYITNPEAIAKYTSEFAQTDSKKGLLVDPNKLAGSELDDLGVKHAAYNIPLSRIVNGSGVSYTYNGKSYHFNKAIVEEYDYVFSTLSKKGITTTAIILNDMSRHTELIHPLARSGGSAPYYAFNAAEESGVEYLAAIASFLAERYSGGSHGKVMNWVIGNEINARHEWNYIEYMDTKSYAEEYAKAFRIFYNAFKSINGNARVYISLDQQWGKSLSNTNGYGAKEVLDAFNDNIKEGGNIDWCVAQHPYNYPLTSAKAWSTSGRAGKLVLDTETTPVLSIKNIHVLSDYMQKEEMLTDSGEVRHIILSEMGYTSTAGQNLQAASFVYAYKIVEANQYIDSMLLSRETDARVEVAMGLAMGLNTQGGGKKSIYNAFKYVDTSKAAEYTDFALDVIGISHWGEVITQH